MGLVLLFSSPIFHIDFSQNKFYNFIELIHMKYFLGIFISFISLLTLPISAFASGNSTYTSPYTISITFTQDDCSLGGHGSTYHYNIFDTTTSTLGFNATFQPYTIFPVTKNISTYGFTSGDTFLVRVWCDQDNFNLVNNSYTYAPPIPTPTPPQTDPATTASTSALISGFTTTGLSGLSIALIGGGILLVTYILLKLTWKVFKDLVKINNVVGGVAHGVGDVSSAVHLGQEAQKIGNQISHQGALRASIEGSIGRIKNIHNE